jgi:transposase
MKNTTIALDIAKSVFEVAVSTRPGKIDLRKRLSRNGLITFLAQQEPATVLLEACGSAHHWGRRIAAIGHEVRLLPAHDVRRYRRGNKTDRADAKAILEAMRNEEILPVPIKSIDQQALTALHRLRSRWIATRTSRINTVRGVLREFGLPIPVGARSVVPRVREWLGEEDTIPGPLAPALSEACDEIGEIESRIRIAEIQLEAIGRRSDDVRRLRTVPGIGLLTGTALVAFIGDARRFPTGRRFASFLGLVPRENSTGQTRRLGPITKRGDTYLRTLLIHGARAVLWHAKKTPDPDRIRKWALEVERTRGHNIAAVALANKMARIAWATWTRKEDYRTAAGTRAA